MSGINMGTGAILAIAATQGKRSPDELKYDRLIDGMVKSVKEGVANAGGRGVENASTIAVELHQDQFSALGFSGKFGLRNAATSPSVLRDITNDLKRAGIKVESIEPNTQGGLNVTAYQKHNLVTGAVAAVAGLRGAWIG